MPWAGYPLTDRGIIERHKQLHVNRRRDRLGANLGENCAVCLDALSQAVGRGLLFLLGRMYARSFEREKERNGQRDAVEKREWPTLECLLAVRPCFAPISPLGRLIARAGRSVGRSVVVVQPPFSNAQSAPTRELNYPLIFLDSFRLPLLTLSSTADINGRRPRLHRREAGRTLRETEPRVEEFPMRGRGLVRRQTFFEHS